MDVMSPPSMQGVKMNPKEEKEAYNYIHIHPSWLLLGEQVYCAVAFCLWFSYSQPQNEPK